MVAPAIIESEMNWVTCSDPDFHMTSDRKDLTGAKFKAQATSMDYLAILVLMGASSAAIVTIWALLKVQGALPSNG